MNRVVIFFIIIVIATNLYSCDQAAAYKRMEKKELASGERQDSLFLGIYFGMSNDDFFKHCWDLNKKRLVKEGPGSSTVEYYSPDFKERVQMLFFPSFYNGKIHEMQLTFLYDAWAPWNKKYQSDKLQEEVVRVFEKWYGKGFIKLEHPKGGALYAKVDGNRRISLWCDGEQKVKGLMKDLTVKVEATTEKVQTDK